MPFIRILKKLKIHGASKYRQTKPGWHPDVASNSNRITDSTTSGRHTSLDSNVRTQHAELNERDLASIEIVCRYLDHHNHAAVLDLGSPGGLVAINSLQFHQATSATYVHSDWNHIEDVLINASERLRGLPKLRSSLTFQIRPFINLDEELVNQHDVITFFFSGDAAQLIEYDSEVRSTFEQLLTWFNRLIQNNTQASLLVLLSHSGNDVQSIQDQITSKISVNLIFTNLPVPCTHQEQKFLLLELKSANDQAFC